MGSELTMTVADLLRGHILIIPEYQRGYAWSARQLNDFRDDLELLDLGRQHYTGTVILCPRPEIRRDDALQRQVVAEVVDGQQRLTTIMMLLDAIRREFLKLPNMEQVATGVASYLSFLEGGISQPRLVLNNQSADFFAKVVLAEDPEAYRPSVPAEERLLFARDSLTYWTAELVSEASVPAEALEELLQKVIEQLRFTLFEVPDDIQAGVIFETVNDRGKPLTELEKVKNYVLYLSSIFDDSQARSLANETTLAWGKIYRRLMSGHLTSSAAEDQFLRAHWLCYHDPDSRKWEGAKSVKTKFAIRSYAQQRDQLHADLIRYVRSLATSCQAYCELAGGEYSSFSYLAGPVPDLEQAADRLRRMDNLASFFPVWLAARSTTRTTQELVELLEACELFAFRVYQVAQVRSNTGQSGLFRLAFRLCSGNASMSEARLDIFARLNSYCSAAVFRATFESEGQREWFGWSGLSYFLNEYEGFLADEMGVTTNHKWSDLVQRRTRETIEHILPQAPTDQAWLDVFTESERKTLTHDLGNLCLTWYNSTLSNRSFDRKKGADGLTDRDGSMARCYANSPLFQERLLCSFAEWTPESIRERRATLTEFALIRWGAPEVDLDPDVANEEAFEDLDIEP
jgi:hypothetical protein